MSDDENKLVIVVRPHVIESFVDGWKPHLRALPESTSNRIGRILLNHLLIEHYLDLVIKNISHKDLNWDGMRLSFHQKTSLLTGPEGVLSELGLISGLRELNKLRNSIAHNLEVKITDDDVPLMYRHIAEVSDDRFKSPEDPLQVIDTFVALACAALLGFITALRRTNNIEHPLKNEEQSGSPD